jgi:hypothetical protein
MTTDGSRREYAIHVDSVVGGWVSGLDSIPFRATVGEQPPTIFASAEHAAQRVQTLVDEYARLGQDHMADHIHVVSRTATTTHSDWKAIDDAELEQARLWNNVRTMNLSPSDALAGITVTNRATPSVRPRNQRAE